MWQVQYLLKVKCHLFVADAALGEVEASLIMAGAVFGEGQVLLFGRCRCDFSWQAQHLVKFGEVQMSLFVAGANAW